MNLGLRVIVIWECETIDTEVVQYILEREKIYIVD